MISKSLWRSFISRELPRRLILLASSLKRYAAGSVKFARELDSNFARARACMHRVRVRGITSAFNAKSNGQFLEVHNIRRRTAHVLMYTTRCALSINLDSIDVRWERDSWNTCLRPLRAASLLFSEIYHVHKNSRTCACVRKFFECQFRRLVIRPEMSKDSGFCYSGCDTHIHTVECLNFYFAIALIGSAQCNNNDNNEWARLTPNVSRVLPNATLVIYH